MSLKALLSTYSQARSAAPEPTRIKPQYKHAQHDALLTIWEQSQSRGGSVSGINGSAAVFAVEDGDVTVGKDSAVAELSANNDLNQGECVLGLLFIIIDKLPFESIWRMWLEECSESRKGRVRIWIHAKFPQRVTSPWVRQHLVKTFQLKPEWGSLELTDVMVRILKEAIEDEGTGLSPTHFVFTSESCVPITTLDKAMKGIIRGGGSAPDLPLSSPSCSSASWLNYNTTSTNGYAQQGQFDVLKGIIPSQCLVKADQWILLSRLHAEAVLSLPTRLGSPILPLFKKVRASDEMYFPCCLAVLGFISSSSSPISSGSTSDAVLQRAVTWCDWSDKGKNPKAYSVLNETDVQAALQRGCLFFRKIKLRDGNLAEETQFAQNWVRLLFRSTDIADYVSNLSDSDITTRVAQIVAERNSVSSSSAHHHGEGHQGYRKEGHGREFGQGRGGHWTGDYGGSHDRGQGESRHRPQNRHGEGGDKGYLQRGDRSRSRDRERRG